MLRIFKITLGLFVAVAVCNKAMAFSFWGPLLSWQTVDLGFGTTYGDLGGPHNLGEEYRMNTGVITYGYSTAFLDYFGDDGVKAVDAAFDILNKLPAVSKMSADLSEYQTQGTIRVNQRAQALCLFDMKSSMLAVLVEHLGLAGESHIFDLRQRLKPANTPACYYEYTVINWNWDPMTFEPTAYVNGVLFSYVIEDDCPTLNEATAYEFPVDSAAAPYSAVASTFALWLDYGRYYNGLTRDDVAGLRYLYRRSNVNLETLATGTAAFTGGSSSSSAFDVPSFWGTNIASGTITTPAATTTTNTVQLLGGVEQIKYVKMMALGVLGTNYRPVNLTYTIPAFMNKWTDVKVQRQSVTVPDILITAADLGPRTYEQTVVSPILSRTYTAASISPSAGTTGTTGGAAGGGGGTGAGGAATTATGVDGPGVFAAQMVVTFSKLGPYSYIEGLGNTAFLTQQYSQVGYVWGYFDGSTNDPIVFPKGTSIQQMEYNVLHSTLNFDQTVGSGVGALGGLGVNIYDPVLTTNSTTTTTGTTGP